MGRYADAARRAARATDEEFASTISSLTRLTDDEITRLFPERTDREKLLELLEIVTEATDENEKIGKLTGNINHLAGSVVRLVELLT